MAFNCAKGAENRYTQLVPSAETRIVPPEPTAANRPLPYATPFNGRSTRRLCRNQFVPFAEVRTVPRSPTATYRPFPCVTEKSHCDCGNGFRCVQRSSGPAGVTVSLATTLVATPNILLAIT